MLSSPLTRIRAFFERSPFAIFFSALAVLFVMIAIAGIYRQPEPTDDTTEREPKTITRFIIGTDTVTATASALVKKETLQPIVALTAGTVEHISVHPGSRIGANTPLLRLSADYGANRAGLETTLAERNQRFALDMAKLDREILTLEKKKARQDSSASDTETDIELKRLKRQRAALNESLSAGELGVDISRAGAAIWEPRAAVSGTVEYLAVQIGDFVTPGTLLALLRTDTGATTLDAFVEPTLARAFDTIRPSHMISGTEGGSLEITPSFFSKSETKNGLFNIRYTLTRDQATEASANTRVAISLPLRTTDDKGHTIIPLDALFIHTDHASIFIEHDGKAEEKTVSIKEIFGNAALLDETLPTDTAVLLGRTLIAGETVASVK